MLNINLEWDSNALAAPQSFRDAVQAAANILDAAIFNPITVNIAVGYGEYDLNGPDQERLTNVSLGGVTNGISLSYSELRTALASNESSTTDVQSVNALPSTASLNGQSNFFISTAQAKAFGVLSPAASAIDGNVGFPTSFTGTDLVNAAITEEVHALGLLYGDLGLFSYTSPGNHYFSTGAATAAYFSLDGGNTNLASYDVGFDSTLFSNQPNDPLDVPIQDATVFTPLDLAEISAIGFDDTSTPVLATPNIIPANTATGSLPAVTVQNVSVAQNKSVSALSLITGASVATGDSLYGYAFLIKGSGTGHFVLGGVVQPVGQVFDVLDTQLSNLSYVGGSASGAQTILVGALDTAYSTSRFAQLTATTTQAETASDFDGDGKSDILFQNTDGSIDAWLMNGYSIASSAIIANPSTAWHPIGAGDFNGDGKADILYQNDDGTIDVWEMNGLTLTNSGIVANPSPAWHALGIGDFDGDGKSDILFQNNDGSIDIWTMNGLSITTSGIVGNPSPAWHPMGVGDFNGDGKSDILFQNDDGTIDIWTMNGLSMTSSGIVANPSPAWHVVGTGDFDGDGKSDILLQNNDGTIDIWTMNGQSITNSGIVADPGPAWHAIGTGDYNGDGKSEILLQNDDGTIDLWTVNGQSLVSSGIVANPSPAWQAVGQGGIHFINGTQTTGTLNGTIQSDDFVFTTFQPGAHVIAGFDPLHDVVTLNPSAFPSFASVQQHETQVAGGTMIDLGGGNSLTLANVLPGALAAKNFV